MREGELAVRHAFAETNGVKLHYVEKGTGPLVLLLHGFPETWWSWRHQIEPLAQAGFRVVAPDLRGYAQSDKQGPYDLDTLAADVVGLVAALGEKRARVVGHDWGGAIAWHLAATRPEACERLCVLNCAHPVQFRKALLTRLSQVRRSWYMFLFQLPRLPEWMLTRQRGAIVRRVYRAHARDATNFGDEEIQPFVDAILEPGAASAVVGYYRAIPMAARNRGRGTRYPVIETPTLLVWGMDDRALGYDDLVPGTERRVRTLRIERIGGAGHFVQAEAPARVNEQLLAFLR